MTAATPAQPASASPHLGCAVCASGVTTPHGAGATPGQAGGISLIAAERLRQVSQEGYSPAHDQEHVSGELASAAACYAIAAADYDLPGAMRAYWPPSWRFSAGDPVRMLAKAGALIAAEIDRLQGPVAAQEPHAAPGESSPLGLKHAVTSNRLGHALAALREIRDGDDALHELVERARTALADDAAIRDNVELTREPQPAPELAAAIVLNMDASGPAQPYEATLIPERIAEPVAAPEQLASLKRRMLDFAGDLDGRCATRPPGQSHTEHETAIELRKIAEPPS